jgi:hypothetical protein
MSRLIPRIRAVKVKTAEDIRDALKVISEVYMKEKRWISSLDDQIPGDLEQHPEVSWFLVRLNKKPAGVLRLLYDPALEFPPEFKVELDKNVNIEKLKLEGRFVEIGRFMIIPEYRTYILIALRLMRAAIREVVEKDYTHFITDVFENEPNSPLKFHTRILGFEIIGRHLFGDLNCSCTRIILTLDILKAYKRLKERRSSIYRTITGGISDLLDKKLIAGKL